MKTQGILKGGTSFPFFDTTTKDSASSLLLAVTGPWESAGEKGLNTLNTQLHIEATNEVSGHQVTQLHQHLFPCERKRLHENGSSHHLLFLEEWVASREGAEGEWTVQHGHGAQRGSKPTHSSSTCLMRRDTLPASLVMRVLHRRAQQKHAN